MTDTDTLIKRLAGEAPLRALRLDRLAMATICAIVLPCVLFLAVAGVRPDLGVAMSRATTLPKTLLPALLLLVALPLALTTLKPAMARPRLGWFLIPLLATAALWLGAFLETPPQTRFADATGPALFECVGLILLLSAPPLAVAIALFRRGAPLHPALTGFLAGLFAAAGAAAGYSLFCTQDNPLFYLTWYGAAVMIAGATGALAGQYWLRW